MMVFKILKFLIGYISASTGPILIKFELEVRFGSNLLHLGFDSGAAKHMGDFEVLVKILPKFCQNIAFLGTFSKNFEVVLSQCFSALILLPICKISCFAPEKPRLFSWRL